MTKPWQVGQRVTFDALLGKRKYHATLIRKQLDGFWVVEDDSGRPPRSVHESRFRVIQPPKGEVFA
jgi:hypothetical protein